MNTNQCHAKIPRSNNSYQKAKQYHTQRSHFTISEKEMEGKKRSEEMREKIKDVIIDMIERE